MGRACQGHTPQIHRRTFRIQSAHTFQHNSRTSTSFNRSRNIRHGSQNLEGVRYTLQLRGEEHAAQSVSLDNAPYGARQNPDGQGQHQKEMGFNTLLPQSCTSSAMARQNVSADVVLQRQPETWQALSILAYRKAAKPHYIEGRSGECMSASKANHCAAVLRSQAFKTWQADRLTILYSSTAPTKDQILVPETLLKKRKSQEKERAEKQQERDAKKKVSSVRVVLRRCDDIFQHCNG